MTAIANLQFCNFVQIVAAREIHSYVLFCLKKVPAYTLELKSVNENNLLEPGIKFL